MPSFSGLKAIVTDIEGTTSSISFVHDVLFPYAAEHLEDYVKAHAQEPAIAKILNEVAEIGELSPSDQSGQIALLLKWIRDDKKVTALKSLQGYIWESGYRRGAYQAHVYADVAPQLRQWKQQKLQLYVYSSGSVLAQKLFFEFSQAGNLLALFDGHFDTTIGAKREMASYRAISEQLALEPERILFLSDIVAELDAAASVGFQVCLLERPGNAPVAATAFPRAESFEQITLESV